MIGFSDLIFFFLGSIGGGVASLFLLRQPKMNLAGLQEKIAKIIEVKKNQAQEILKITQEKVTKFNKQTEEELARLKNSLENTEKVLVIKENTLNKRIKRNEDIKNMVLNEADFIKEVQLKSRDIKTAFIDKLVEKTDLSLEEAKNYLINTYRQGILEENESKLQKITDEIKGEAQRLASNIVIEAIHRFSSPTSVEKKTKNVHVNRDQVKAEIVGKNAFNVKLIEELMGVDVIFNDLPDTITISGGEPIKRHIATLSIEKLSKQRNINPEKIKEIIAATTKETELGMFQDGKEAANSLKLKDLHPDLLKIIGRLNFRTSYGQNILKHSLEVAALATILASEIGANIEISRTAAFLHDIGKAIDYEVEGSHDAIGRDLLTKYNFPEAVIHAVYAHHEAVPAKSLEDLVVKTADAISAGRPGARQESLEKYLLRLNELESIAMAFNGVKKCYAISAGREIRVLVDPEKLNDTESDTLAENIASKIESALTYPGKIKINVIRKTIATDFAH